MRRFLDFRVLCGDLELERELSTSNEVTRKLIKTKIAKLGENMSVARFVRFKVGDTMAAESSQSQE